MPKEADKYKGAFDDGWDAYREKVFAKQKELGIMPQDAELSGTTRTSRYGTSSMPTRGGSTPASWRSSPASWSTPTTTSAG